MGEVEVVSPVRRTVDATGDLAPPTPPEAIAGNPNNRFAQWFKDWRKPVRHWLSRRAAVPAAELDDLAQEVFLRLLRYSEKTAVENPPWIFAAHRAAMSPAEWRERARVSKPHGQEWLDDLLIEPDQEPENSVCQARTDEQRAGRRRQAAVPTASGSTVASKRGTDLQANRRATQVFAACRAAHCPAPTVTCGWAGPRRPK